MWYNINMQNNIKPQRYSTTYQLKLPLEISTIIEVSDPVYTFCEVMEHIDLRKYLVIEEHKTGRKRYDSEILLKVILFAFMERGYASVREIEKLCKTDIRFMWLLEGEPTPSVATIKRFQSEKLSEAIEGQNTADFFTIVTWRNTAEFVSRSFRKGRPILVCGQLQNRTWTDSQGVKRYATEIVADEVDFVDSKPDGVASQGAGQGDGQYATDAYGTPAYSNRGDAQANVDFVDVADDSGLPF